MNAQRIAEQFIALRAKRPLVHHITNYVTVNDCANITLSIGGAPVMAEAHQEVAEMVSMAGALVLNIGTLRSEQVEAMVLAGRRANEIGVPIVLDPVGAGATRYRTETARKLLDELDITVLKGNAGEIGLLAGTGGVVKGVDSHGMSGDPVSVCRDLAEREKLIVAMSGATDIVSDGTTTYLVDNGHEMMGRISGTGCMATSIVGAFIASSDDKLLGSAGALSAFGIAGENAARNARGPYAVKTALFDEVASLTPEVMAQRAKVRSA